MRRFTKGKTITIPMSLIEMVDRCQTDFEFWSAVLSAGLTTAVKPETVSSAQFYEEEVKVLEEVQRLGGDNSALYKNRWAL